MLKFLDNLVDPFKALSKVFKLIKQGGKQFVKLTNKAGGEVLKVIDLGDKGSEIFANVRKGVNQIEEVKVVVPNGVDPKSMIKEIGDDVFAKIDGQWKLLGKGSLDLDDFYKLIHRLDDLGDGFKGLRDNLTSLTKRDKLKFIEDFVNASDDLLKVLDDPDNFSVWKKMLSQDIDSVLRRSKDAIEKFGKVICN